MTLQPGSHGPLVSRWTQVMLKRFRAYALGVNGLPLVDDGYFGNDEAKVLNNGPLAWRLKDFKRGLAFGNPDRAADAICSWATNPPSKGTGGIMIDDRFVTKGTPLEYKWAENARHGDMFAEGGTDPEGLNKSAIAKIVTQNSWSGGDAALLSRLIAIMGNIPQQSIPVVLAIVSAIKFAVANPNPHYTTVSTPGDVAWMRGVAP